MNPDAQTKKEQNKELPASYIAAAEQGDVDA